VESPESSLPPYARRVEGGVELRIKVVPGASRSEIAGVLGDRLKVRVAAPAEGGKANEALLEILRGWLGTADVHVASGHGRPIKTIRVGGPVALPELRPRPEPSGDR